MSYTYEEVRRQLLDLIASIQRDYQRQLQPYVEQLARLEASRPLPPMLIALGYYDKKRVDMPGFNRKAAMSGIKYEVLTEDALLSALRGGACGDLLEDAGYAAADEIERLQRVLEKVMARCADLLDEDQFNELDAMTRTTETVPGVAP